MKSIIIFSVLILLCSCSNELDEITPSAGKFSWRTLPSYIVPYQHSSGDIRTKTSSNLINWYAGYTASTTSSLFGTTSTIYNYMIPDTARKCIVLFQNSSNTIKFVEYKDGNTSWSSPASVSTATSHLLPTVELYDGSVHEAHAVQEISGCYVKGSEKSGSSWSSPGYHYKTIMSAPGYAKIICDYSPTLEYHSSAGVEYLVTVDVDNEFSGYGLPYVYWRYNTTNFTSTTSPAIGLGVTSGELNASITPVALEDNGDDKLYLFFTYPGTSTQATNRIYFYIGSVTGSTNGAITSWDGPFEVGGGAYTSNKIDGIFIDESERIVIIYKNCYTDEIDIAYSDDFGDNWSIETDIAVTTGAPSIVNLE